MRRARLALLFMSLEAFLMSDIDYQEGFRDGVRSILTHIINTQFQVNYPPSFVKIVSQRVERETVELDEMKEGVE